ncbi:hypothetical protein RclHR1_03890001 [Rhizophagus clarus]|uniref:Uncharacterized protein n=1 Tax=Rhizophagus clarus TaxID=94130 RepID=A0A2Z6RD80_9GLOM|nr:hypothetical protein RclHR1_03890001 [Rhizophagus clarus]
MNDFFDTFEIILDDKNFWWAFQYSFLFAKDASKKEIAAALYKDNDLLKNILDDSYDPQWLSDEFMDMKISINKEYQSQVSVALTSTNQNEDRTSQKQDKQKAKVVEHVTSDIPALELVPVVIPQPEVIPQSASNSSLKPMAKPFVFRTKSEKTKDNSNDLGDNATQILTGYHFNPSLGRYVYDILIYDVPAKWENITILDYLKAWSNVISVTFIKECKERERFQAVVEGPPESLTADVLAAKEHLTNFLYLLHIKAFKEVKNPDGTRKMIAYFESWEDLQNIISKESFWNGTKLSWCRQTYPSFITRRKSS